MRSTSKRTHSKHGLRSQRSLQSKQLNSLNSGEGYTSEGYTSYISTNKTNPNPTLDFTNQSRLGYRHGLKHKYHTDYKQTSQITNYYSNQNHYVPPQIPSQEYDRHKLHKGMSYDSTQLNSDRQGYEMLELKRDYTSDHHGHVYDQEAEETVAVQWDGDETDSERLTHLEAAMDTGWFWVYKQFMWGMYWFSLLLIFSNVLGLLVPGYRIYCISHILKCAWAAQQFWYMHNAAKDRLLWAAERACEMFKYYLWVAPGLLAIVNFYFGFELEYGLISHIVSSYIVVGGLFYLGVMKKGIELRDILRQRDELRQRLIAQGMSV